MLRESSKPLKRRGRKPQATARCSGVAQWLVHVIAPILVGTTIYLSWRSTTLRLFDWGDNLGMAEVLRTVRSAAWAGRESVPGWVAYSLPDALWSYAFTCALCFVWASRGYWERSLWLLVPLVVTTGSELLQGSGLIVGTFDWIDVLLSGAACVLALLLFAPTHPFHGGQRHAYSA